MSIPITTPALLFPAIAILMLGYVNRYLGTASVIRALKKDYDTGYKRVNVVAQLKILQKRIELSRYMLEIGALPKTQLWSWRSIRFGSTLLPQGGYKRQELSQCKAMVQPTQK